MKILAPAEGDSITLSETPDGYKISSYDPEIARQIEIAKKIMRRYRNTLRELAK